MVASDGVLQARDAEDLDLLYALFDEKVQEEGHACISIENLQECRDKFIEQRPGQSNDRDLASADLDGDGIITFAEYLRFLLNTNDSRIDLLKFEFEQFERAGSTAGSKNVEKELLHQAHDHGNVKDVQAAIASSGLTTSDNVGFGGFVSLRIAIDDADKVRKSKGKAGKPTGHQEGTKGVPHFMKSTVQAENMSHAHVRNDKKTMALLDECYKMFQAADLDHNGTIGMDEFEKLFIKMIHSKKVPHDFIAERMSDIDFDDDGVIDFPEFVKFMCGYTHDGLDELRIQYETFPRKIDHTIDSAAFIKVVKPRFPPTYNKHKIKEALGISSGHTLSFSTFVTVMDMPAIGDEAVQHEEGKDMASKRREKMSGFKEKTDRKIATLERRRQDEKKHKYELFPEAYASFTQLDKDGTGLVSFQSILDNSVVVTVNGKPARSSFLRARESTLRRRQGHSLTFEDYVHVVMGLDVVGLNASKLSFESFGVADGKIPFDTFMYAVPEAAVGVLHAMRQGRRSSLAGVTRQGGRDNDPVDFGEYVHICYLPECAGFTIEAGNAEAKATFDASYEAADGDQASQIPRYMQHTVQTKALVRSKVHEDEATMRVLNQCYKSFAEIDRDHSGVITMAELEIAFVKLVHSKAVPHSFLVERMAEVDFDHDGEIEFHEYVEFICHYTHPNLDLLRIQYETFPRNLDHTIDVDHFIDVYRTKFPSDANLNYIKEVLGVSGGSTSLSFATFVQIMDMPDHKDAQIEDDGGKQTADARKQAMAVRKENTGDRKYRLKRRMEEKKYGHEELAGLNELHEAFAAMDSDDTGCISTKELMLNANTIKVHNQPVSAAVLQARYSSLNMRDKGDITFEVLVQVVLGRAIPGLNTFKRRYETFGLNEGSMTVPQQAVLDAIPEKYMDLAMARMHPVDGNVSLEDYVAVAKDPKLVSIAIEAGNELVKEAVNDAHAGEKAEANNNEADGDEDDDDKPHFMRSTEDSRDVGRRELKHDKATMAMVDRAYRAFSEADSDHSGTIDAAGLEKIFLQFIHTKKVPQEYIAERMAEIDPESDGLMEFSDFVQFVCHYDHPDLDKILIQYESFPSQADGTISVEDFIKAYRSKIPTTASDDKIKVALGIREETLSFSSFLHVIDIPELVGAEVEHEGSTAEVQARKQRLASREGQTKMTIKRVSRYVKPGHDGLQFLDELCSQFVRLDGEDGEEDQGVVALSRLISGDAKMLLYGSLVSKEVLEARSSVMGLSPSATLTMQEFVYLVHGTDIEHLNSWKNSFESFGFEHGDGRVDVDAVFWATPEATIKEAKKMRGDDAAVSISFQEYCAIARLCHDFNITNGNSKQKERRNKLDAKEAKRLKALKHRKDQTPHYLKHTAQTNRITHHDLRHDKETMHHLDHCYELFHELDVDHLGRISLHDLELVLHKMSKKEFAPHEWVARRLAEVHSDVDKYIGFTDYMNYTCGFEDDDIEDLRIQYESFPKNKHGHGLDVDKFIEVIKPKFPPKVTSKQLKHALNVEHGHHLRFSAFVLACELPGLSGEDVVHHESAELVASRRKVAKERQASETGHVTLHRNVPPPSLHGQTGFEDLNHAYETFDRLDKNNNGLAVLKDLLGDGDVTAYGKPMSTHMIHTRMKHFDYNEHTEIGFREFVHFVLGVQIKHLNKWKSYFESFVPLPEDVHRIAQKDFLMTVPADALDEAHARLHSQDGSMGMQQYCAVASLTSCKDTALEWTDDFRQLRATEMEWAAAAEEELRREQDRSAETIRIILEAKAQAERNTEAERLEKERLEKENEELQKKLAAKKEAEKLEEERLEKQSEELQKKLAIEEALLAKESAERADIEAELAKEVSEKAAWERKLAEDEAQMELHELEAELAKETAEKTELEEQLAADRAQLTNDATERADLEAQLAKEHAEKLELEKKLALEEAELAEIAALEEELAAEQAQLAKDMAEKDELEGQLSEEQAMLEDLKKAEEEENDRADLAYMSEPDAADRERFSFDLAAEKRRVENERAEQEASKRAAALESEVTEEEALAEQDLEQLRLMLLQEEEELLTLKMDMTDEAAAGVETPRADELHARAKQVQEVVETVQPTALKMERGNEGAKSHDITFEEASGMLDRAQAKEIMLEKQLDTIMDAEATLKKQIESSTLDMEQLVGKKQDEVEQKIISMAAELETKSKQRELLLAEHQAQDEAALKMKEVIMVEKLLQEDQEARARLSERAAELEQMQVAKRMEWKARLAAEEEAIGDRLVQRQKEMRAEREATEMEIAAQEAEMKAMVAAEKAALAEEETTLRVKLAREEIALRETTLEGKAVVERLQKDLSKDEEFKARLDAETGALVKQLEEAKREQERMIRAEHDEKEVLRQKLEQIRAEKDAIRKAGAEAQAKLVEELAKAEAAKREMMRIAQTPHAVLFVLNLAMNYSHWDSAAARLLVKNIAQLAGLEPAQIHMVRAKPGSVLVDLYVTTDGKVGPPPAHAVAKAVSHTIVDGSLATALADIEGMPLDAVIILDARVMELPVLQDQIKRTDEMERIREQESFKEEAKTRRRSIQIVTQLAEEERRRQISIVEADELAQVHLRRRASIEAVTRAEEERTRRLFDTIQEIAQQPELARERRQSLSAINGGILQFAKDLEAARALAAMTKEQLEAMEAEKRRKEQEEEMRLSREQQTIEERARMEALEEARTQKEREETERWEAQEKSNAIQIEFEQRKLRQKLRADSIAEVLIEKKNVAMTQYHKEQKHHWPVHKFFSVETVKSREDLLVEDDKPDEHNTIMHRAVTRTEETYSISRDFLSDFMNKSKFGKAWTYSLLLLAIVNFIICVCVSFSFENSRPEHEHLGLRYTFLVISMVFVIDVLIEWMIAHDKMRHIMSAHFCFDSLIVILPCFLYEYTDLFYVVQALRLGRALESLDMIERSAFLNTKGHTSRLIVRERMVMVRFVMTLGVAVSVISLWMPYLDSDVFSNFFEGVYFTVVMLSTVGYGEFSPSTRVARFVVLIGILLSVALLQSEIYHVLQMLGRAKSRRVGTSISKHTEFILVVGHFDAQTVRGLLRTVNTQEKLTDMQIKVKFMSPAEAPEELQSVFQEPGIAHRVEFVCADPTDPNDLETHKVQDAMCTMILADNLTTGNAELSDARSILYAVSLKRILEGQPGEKQTEQDGDGSGAPEPFSNQDLLTKYQKRRPVKLIVEVIQDRAAKIILKLGVSQCFCVTEISAALVTNNVRCPGFSTMLLNLIQSTPVKEEESEPDDWMREYQLGLNHEIVAYMIPDEFAGLDYQSVVLKLRSKYGVLVIGVATSDNTGYQQAPFLMSKDIGINDNHRCFLAPFMPGFRIKKETTLYIIKKRGVVFPETDADKGTLLFQDLNYVDADLETHQILTRTGFKKKAAGAHINRPIAQSLPQAGRNLSVKPPPAELKNHIIIIGSFLDCECLLRRLRSGKGDSRFTGDVVFIHVSPPTTRQQDILRTYAPVYYAKGVGYNVEDLKAASVHRAKHIYVRLNLQVDSGGKADNNALEADGGHLVALRTLTMLESVLKSKASSASGKRFNPAVTLDVVETPVGEKFGYCMEKATRAQIHNDLQMSPAYASGKLVHYNLWRRALLTECALKSYMMFIVDLMINGQTVQNTKTGSYHLTSVELVGIPPSLHGQPYERLVNFVLEQKMLPLGLYRSGTDASGVVSDNNPISSPRTARKNRRAAPPEGSGPEQIPVQYMLTNPDGELIVQETDRLYVIMQAPWDASVDAPEMSRKDSGFQMEYIEPPPGSDTSDIDVESQAEAHDDYQDMSDLEQQEVEVFARMRGCTEAIPWIQIRASFPYEETEAATQIRDMMFKNFDRNSNGKLTLAEVYEGLKRAFTADDMLAMKPAILHAFNTSRAVDGAQGYHYLGGSQFRLFLQYLRQYIEYSYAFRVLDFDGDSRITMDEFVAARLAVESWLGKVDCVEEYDKMDLSGKGHVTFDEFCDWCLLRGVSLQAKMQEVIMTEEEKALRNKLEQQAMEEERERLLAEQAAQQRAQEALEEEDVEGSEINSEDMDTEETDIPFVLSCAVTLDTVFADWDSAAEQVFVIVLADLLEVPAYDLQVTKTTEGSVVLDFYISFKESGPYPAYAMVKKLDTVMSGEELLSGLELKGIHVMAASLTKCEVEGLGNMLSRLAAERAQERAEQAQKALEQAEAEQQVLLQQAAEAAANPPIEITAEPPVKISAEASIEVAAKLPAEGATKLTTDGMLGAPGTGWEKAGPGPVTPKAVAVDEVLEATGDVMAQAIDLLDAPERAKARAEAEAKALAEEERRAREEKEARAAEKARLKQLEEETEALRMREEELKNAGAEKERAMREQYEAELAREKEIEKVRQEQQERKQEEEMAMWAEQVELARIEAEEAEERIRAEAAARVAFARREAEKAKEDALAAKAKADRARQQAEEEERRIKEEAAAKTKAAEEARAAAEAAEAQRLADEAAARAKAEADSKAQREAEALRQQLAQRDEEARQQKAKMDEMRRQLELDQLRKEADQAKQEATELVRRFSTSGMPSMYGMPVEMPTQPRHATMPAAAMQGAVGGFAHNAGGFSYEEAPMAGDMLHYGPMAGAALTQEQREWRDRAVQAQREKEQLMQQLEQQKHEMELERARATMSKEHYRRSMEIKESMFKQVEQARQEADDLKRRQELEEIQKEAQRIHKEKEAMERQAEEMKKMAIEQEKMAERQRKELEESKHAEREALAARHAKEMEDAKKAVAAREAELRKAKEEKEAVEKQTKEKIRKEREQRERLRQDVQKAILAEKEGIEKMRQEVEEKTRLEEIERQRLEKEALAARREAEHQKEALTLHRRQSTQLLEDAQRQMAATVAEHERKTKELTEKARVEARAEAEREIAFMRTMDEKRHDHILEEQEAIAAKKHAEAVKLKAELDAREQEMAREAQRQADDLRERELEARTGFGKVLGTDMNYEQLKASFHNMPHDQHNGVILREFRRWIEGYHIQLPPHVEEHLTAKNVQHVTWGAIAEKCFHMDDAEHPNDTYVHVEPLKSQHKQNVELPADMTVDMIKTEFFALEQDGDQGVRSRTFMDWLKKSHIKIPVMARNALSAGSHVTWDHFAKILGAGSH